MIDSTLPQRHTLQTVTEIPGPFRVVSPTTGRPLLEVTESHSGGGVLRIFDAEGRLALQLGCTGIHPGHHEIAMFRKGSEDPTVVLLEDGTNSEVRVSSGDGDGPAVALLADKGGAIVEIAETSTRFRQLTPA